MQIGGSWLVRKGHCSECCVGRDKQGWWGLCVSHSPHQTSDQGQTWLPLAPLLCQGTCRERWGEEWEQRNSLHGQHQLSGTTSSWDGTFCFSGLLDSSLATSSCRILLLWLLSASQPCSLQTLLSLFSSLWSWPNYPPPHGLRCLLPSCNVCSPCSSVPVSPIK